MGADFQGFSLGRIKNKVESQGYLNLQNTLIYGMISGMISVKKTRFLGTPHGYLVEKRKVKA